MPGPDARRLTLEHQAQLAALADDLAKQVRKVVRGADGSAIDLWWLKAFPKLIELIAAFFTAILTLTRQYMIDHAATEGRVVDHVDAEWITERVATSLRVMGPVAFKRSISNGRTPEQAINAMAEQLAGAAVRHALAASRETLTNTVEAGGEVIGWRRVPDADPCAFCALLVSRGAVYHTGASAGDVRFGGEPYHDNDQCTAEPLYEHEDEPAEVQALYDAWQRVTAGKSGNDAIRAWREWWDDGRKEELATPARVPEPRQRLEVVPFDLAEAFRGEKDSRFLDLPGDEERQAVARQATLDQILANIEKREPLGGGTYSTTELVTLRNGEQYVYKFIKFDDEDLPAKHQVDAEILGAHIARALGLQAPDVFQASDDELYMTFMDGRLVADALLFRRDVLGDRIRAGEIARSADGHALRLLDILIDNADRNDGNWLIDKDDHIQAIDHGLAWLNESLIGEPPVFGSDMLEGFAVGSGVTHDWIDNPLSREDVDTLTQRIAALRPEFETRDRLDWWQYTMDRLEVIGEHASGTERMIR